MVNLFLFYFIEEKPETWAGLTRTRPMFKLAENKMEILPSIPLHLYLHPYYKKNPLLPFCYITFCTTRL